MNELKIFSTILYSILGIYMIYNSNNNFYAISIGIITIVLGMLIYQYWDKLVIYVEGDKNE